MKYIIVFLLFAMLIAGCSQIENPLDSQDAIGAPGADVNDKAQQIVINCEPAYLISVSPESGSEITPDTELIFTFSSAPGYFGINSQIGGIPWGHPPGRTGHHGNETLFFGDIQAHGWQNIEKSYEIIWAVSEANRNIVKVSIFMAPGGKELYKRLGRPAHTDKWEFYISWQHGYMPISYDVVFPEIEAAEPPPNIPFQDILNTPHEFLGKEVTFEAVLSKFEGDGKFGLETGMITRHFYIRSYNLVYAWIDKKISIGQKWRFSCVISNVTERDDGLITIEARQIRVRDVVIYPPVFIPE